MERPEPGPNEIQIRVRACALCTWEQRVFTGEKPAPLPLVGGHELAGEISALGTGVDPKQYPVGARVAARVIKACNSCYYCRRGEPTQCVELNTFRLNGPSVYGMGGLAEYICLDRSAVWRYDEQRPFAEIALTEPLACVLHSIRRAWPKMGDDAVVIGGGVMGQLHLLCLQKMGIRTVLSEPDAVRRAFAAAHGCSVVIDPVKEDAVARVLQLTGGRGAETVFNTTAVSAVEKDAIRMTGKLGCCVTFSSQHPDSPVQVSPNWLHNSESILTGAVNPSVISFDQAVNVLSKGLLDIRDLISAVYPKEEAMQAFLDAIRPDTYRVEIRF
jgi:L-iditol 2-dehydrogenase